MKRPYLRLLFVCFGSLINGFLPESFIQGYVAVSYMTAEKQMLWIPCLLNDNLLFSLRVLLFFTFQGIWKLYYFSSNLYSFTM